MRFVCDLCKSKKIIPREAMESIPTNEFADNDIFICHKCKIRMRPASVETDL